MVGEEPDLEPQANNSAQPSRRGLAHGSSKKTAAPLPSGAVPVSALV